MQEETVSKNFIEQEIDKDLAEGVYSEVCTRFPPEPNGYLHIGHAKSILLNSGLAKKYHGTFHLRFDDTNPTKEDTEFVESIKEDVKWLGADWKDHLYFASDYFDVMYECALKPVSYTHLDVYKRQGRVIFYKSGTAEPDFVSCVLLGTETEFFYLRSRNQKS